MILIIWGYHSSANLNENFLTQFIRALPNPGAWRKPNQNNRGRNVFKFSLYSFFNQSDGWEKPTLTVLDGRNICNRRRGAELLYTSKKSTVTLLERIFAEACKQKKMHRTQTDVTFVEHFIMFHCHRKLIINYNFYEHFFTNRQENC